MADTAPVQNPDGSYKLDGPIQNPDGSYVLDGPIVQPKQPGIVDRAISTAKDIGKGVSTGASEFGRLGENLGRSLGGALTNVGSRLGIVSPQTQQAVDEANVEAIGRNNAYVPPPESLPTTTAGQIAQSLTTMAPAVGLGILNPVAGLAAFGAQGAFQAGEGAIKEGDSVANAQLKAVGQGALNTALGNVVGGAGNALLSKIPVVGDAFAPGAADTAAGIGKRMLQGAGTMAAFKPAGTAIDYAADTATGESKGKDYDWVPSAADLATGALMVLPHAALEYVGRNKMPAQSAELADGTQALFHKNGMPFSSSTAAQSFIDANGLDAYTVNQVTERSFDPESKTDKPIGYAVSPKPPEVPAEPEAPAETKALPYYAGPPMVTFPDGTSMTRADYEVRRANGFTGVPVAESQPAPEAPAEPKALPHIAGPALVTFPDGSTMTGAEAERYRLNQMIKPADSEPEPTAMQIAMEAAKAKAKAKLGEGTLGQAASVGIDQGEIAVAPDGSMSAADHVAANPNHPAAKHIERPEQSENGGARKAGEQVGGTAPAGEAKAAETAPDKPVERGYSQAQAEQYAKRMTAQNLPSEVVPHPTEPGRFAIVPATDESRSGAKQPEPGKGWKNFGSESGTLNIPRAEMPQIKAEHRGAMVNFLNARGIEHEQVDVPASSLKPTQAEYSPAKVEKAKKFEGGDRSILISSDNHVVDGHHQWLAKKEAGEPIQAIRLGAPIRELLPIVAEFPSAKTANGAPASDARVASEVKPEPKVLNKPVSAINDRTLDVLAKSKSPDGEVARSEIARRSRSTPIDDPRLKDETVRAALKSMPGDAGWSEVGGRLVRRQEGGKEIVERTKWIPRSPWFVAGLGNETFIRGAVEKALAGEPMRAAEKRTVQHMLDYLHDQMHPELDKIDTNVLADAGVLDNTSPERDALESMLSDAEEAHFAAEKVPEFTSRPMSDAEVAAWLGENDVPVVAEDQRPAEEAVAGQPQESGAPGAAAARGEAFQLDGQTREGLAARDAQNAAAEAERVKDEQAAEQKRKADAERGNFGLTGSDRAADANPNQGDIFAKPAAENGSDDVSRTKEILDAAGVTGRERTATIAEVRRGDLTADDVAESHPGKGAVASHAEMMDLVRSGDISANDFKAKFDAMVGNKDGILAELSAMTKPAIFKEFPRLEYRYKNDKKADVVKAAYRSMLDDFVLGDSISWSMGEKYENVIHGYVEKTTDDALRKYSDEVKSASEERETQRRERAAGMENPQTLDDYKRLLTAKAQELGEGTTFKQARMALTPEQRAAFDELAATESRDQRKARADQQKTEVRVAAQTTDGQVIETKHTRTGEPLFVVKAAERVERDVYTQWNATAKRLGGWYSSYRGDGAVPGFQFKTRENADAFLKFIGGDVEQAQEAVQARRDAFADDRSQSAVERLNEMAGRLEERANESLGRDRKANTERRARMAAGAEAAANDDKALAQTMRNIAQAIDSGKAKFLDRVRQKVQIELLRSALRTAKDAELREKYPAYGDQEKHRGDAPTAATADYAEFPQYTAFRSDLASLGRQLIAVDGTKLLGQRIMKVADDVSTAYLKFAKENFHEVSQFTGKDGAKAGFKTALSAEEAINRSGFRGTAIPFKIKNGEYAIVFSPSEAIERGIWKGDGDKRVTLSPEFGADLVDKIGKVSRRGNSVSVPWQFETAHDRRSTLARMGIESPAEYRAALREFAGLRVAPTEPDQVKKLEREMVGRKNDGLDFFPTPATQADEMVDAADIKEGMSVYEPQAGMGHIADRIREAGIEPDAGEIDQGRRALLEAKGYNLVSRDFMEMRPEDTPNGAGYDRIIMNPPFSDRRDVQHVQHAYELLKPGGRVVALMGEGSFFGQDKKAQAFRDWMESVGGTSEKLDEGTFMDPSLPVNTGVNARMVVVDKPETKETDKGTALYSRAEPGEGETADKVREWINPTLDKLKNIPDVEVVHDQSEIPAVQERLKSAAARYLREGDTEAMKELRSFEDNPVEGAYLDGKIWLVAGNLKSQERALKVLSHEAVGHMSVEHMLDHADPALMPRLVKQVDLLDRAANPYVRELAAAVDKSQPGLERDARAKEIIAMIAERGDHAKDMPGVVRSVWQRIVDGIKAFAKLAFGHDLSDRDVRDIVATAERWAQGDEHVTAMVDGQMKTLQLSRGSEQSTEPEEIKVPGFASFEAYQKKDGSANFYGTVKVGSERYFASIKVTRDESGKPKIGLTDYRFETMTGKSVRGSANVKLEGLMESAKEAALSWASTHDSTNTAGDPTNPDIRFSRAAPDWAKESPEMLEAARKAGVWKSEESIGDRLKELRTNWKDKFIQGAVDQFAALKKLGMKEYVLARMASGSDSTMEALLRFGTPKINSAGAADITPDGKGFIGTMQQLKEDPRRFLSWVAGNRAEKLMAEGRENNFTKADIDQLKTLNRGKLSDGSSREATYLKALSDFNRYQKSVLDLAEKSGIIDPESRKTWESEFYVPFYREAEEDERVKGPRANLSGLVNPKGVKRLKGGEDALSDPLANTLLNWQHLINASLRNRAATAALESAEKAGIADKVPAGTKGSVFVLKDGKEQHYDVSDPFIYKAITALDPAPMTGPVAKMMGTFKHILTVGTTASPAFRVAHTLREQLTAVAANPTTYNILGNWVNGLKLSGKDNPLYAHMLAGGSFMQLAGHGERGEETHRLIMEGIHQDQVLDTAEKLKNALPDAWRWWKEVGERSDSITRANLYKQVYDQNVAKGASADEAHLMASYAARDVMDFGLKGTWNALRLITGTVPFMNARIQGLYKLGRGAADDPKRFSLVMGATTLATIALTQWNKQNNPEIDDLPEYVRDSYWVVKMPGMSKALFVPKPFEVGAMATVADRGMEALLNGMRPQDRQRFISRLMPIIGSQLNMNPTPQMVMPLAETWANKDFFRGSPIETAAMQNREVQDRIGPNTSAVAVLAGKAGVLSPVQIDHLINAYFGWLGTTVNTAASAAAGKAMDLPAKPSGRAEDIPVTGRFFRDLPSDQSRYLSEFYDQQKQVAQLMGSIHEHIKEGDIEGARQMMKDNQAEVGISKMLSGTATSLSKINNMIRLVEDSRSLDPEAKRARIDSLMATRNRLAENARNRAISAGAL